jgi:hypothetical protein
MNSNPGYGPNATLPSNIDRRQDEDLRRHYADDMVGIIAVQDGWLRIFGGSTRQDPFAITWLGKGVEVSEEDPYVFKLQLS